MHSRKIVAIFGSSRVKPDSELYQATYALAQAIAHEDYVVMTGGYDGVMEAASKGAAEAGGHVIGVSAAPLEKLRRVRPNEWLKQVIPFDTLHERLAYMIVKADAYVVMPGGLGTFAELLMAWEMVRVGDVPPRPLICYGDYWQRVLEPLHRVEYVISSDWLPLLFADSSKAVLSLLQEKLG